MIEIDTETTLYVCTDGANAEVHILVPPKLPVAHIRLTIEHLRLDDPDPHGPNGSDRAIFKILRESGDMEHHTFDV